MRPRYFGHPSPVRLPDNIDRRKFVALIGGTVLLSACDKYPQALLGPSAPLAAPRASAVVNAKDLGATGDGLTDDTSAINAAVSSLGPDGGTVSLPAGVYLIDPTTSLSLNDNVTLLLDQGATLQAIAVAAGSSAIVKASGVANVAVIGGKIVGERAAHLGASGEWGMGIRITGCSNVRIDGVQISDCWGDGIYIGAAGIGKESQNVDITKCVSRNNRRQGLSITGCRGATIRDCEFTDTNGTLPASGIDLEPNDSLNVVDVVIDNCLIARNAGHGLLLVGATVRNAEMVRNHIVDNCFAGVAFLRGVNQCQLSDNTIKRNAENGVLLEAALQNEIVGNTIHHNSLASADQYANVILRGGSSHNTIAENRFGDLRRLSGNTGTDVVITDDCHDNIVEVAAVVKPGDARRP